jgi:hypothetical protein
MAGDTTTKLQTKDWEHMSVRLPEGVKDALRKDAIEEMRPIGLHASYIIQQYLKEKKEVSNG